MKRIPRGFSYKWGKQKYALVTAEGKLIDKFISKEVAKRTKKYYERQFFMNDLKIIPIDELKNDKH